MHPHARTRNTNLDRAQLLEVGLHGQRTQKINRTRCNYTLGGVILEKLLARPELRNFCKCIRIPLRDAWGQKKKKRCWTNCQKIWKPAESLMLRSVKRIRWNFVWDTRLLGGQDWDQA